MTIDDIKNLPERMHCPPGHKLVHFDSIPGGSTLIVYAPAVYDPERAKKMKDNVQRIASRIAWEYEEEKQSGI